MNMVSRALHGFISGCTILALASCAQQDPTTTSGVLKRAAAVVEDVADAVGEIETVADVSEASATFDRAADELTALGAIAKGLPAPGQDEKEAIREASERMKTAIDHMNANFERIKAEHAEARDSLAEAMLPFQLALTELSFDIDPMFKVMQQGLARTRPSGTPHPSGLLAPTQVPPSIPGPPPEALIPFAQRLANFKNRHGPERVVIVELSGLAEPVDLGAIAAELRAVAACGNNTSSPEGGKVLVALAPVPDFAAFIEALDWGDESVDEATRTIRVTVNPDLLPETLRQRP